VLYNMGYHVCIVLQGVVVCYRALQCVAGGVSLCCKTWATRYVLCCRVL